MKQVCFAILCLALRAGGAFAQTLAPLPMKSLASVDDRASRSGRAFMAQLLDQVRAAADIMVTKFTMEADHFHSKALKWEGLPPQERGQGSGLPAPYTLDAREKLAP